MTTDGVALIYGACLLVGLIYSAMQFVFGAHHGVDTGGHGLDVGHHGWDLSHMGHFGHAPDVHVHAAGHAVGHADAGGHTHGTGLEDGTAPQTVSFINPLTLGTWVTTFGGFGLIALALLRSVPLSLGVSFVTSFLATLLVFYLFVQLLIQPEVVRDMTADDTIGLEAEVTVSIPDGGGMGQVAYILDAQRFTASAKSEDGAPIARGSQVRIVQAVGQTATVRRKDASAA